MYAKIFTQIYDGTLCTEGPWEALVTFQQMLVLADPEGTVDMTAEAIARRTTIPLDIIRTGIAKLTQPDPHSRTPDFEGRRLISLSENRHWGWKIVNYAHYREMKREEDRRDYHRTYYREVRKKNNESQHSQQISTGSTDSTEEVESKHINTYAPDGADASFPESKKNPNPEHRVKRDKGQKSIPVAAPADVAPAIWDDWLAIRKAKRLPVTETALAGFQREAGKAGLTVEAAMRTCCERGWAGFKAEWLVDPREAAQKSKLDAERAEMFRGAL